MTTGEMAWVAGALLAVMAITSAPGVMGLRGAGPRYRRAVWRQLAVGWTVAALVVGWMVVGWIGLNGPPRWWPAYRTTTLVLMVVWGPLLLWGIRRSVRTAARAQEEDAATP